MQRIHFFLFFFLIIVCNISPAQVKIHPDSTNACLLQLKGLRQKLISSKPVNGRLPVELISKMLESGLWEQASVYLYAADQSNAKTKLLWADYYILQNNFKKAETYVNNVLAKQQFHNKALLLKAFLEIQAWRLPVAVSICDKIIQRYPENERAKLMKGKALLLLKNYSAALDIAMEVEKKNPSSAGAYLLEADVYFWDQHPEKAEAPLFRSLEIDPYNADARFSYGYAIWRRVDATQLNAMLHNGKWR
jgi:tetratricopeptide (TPR) repeat protein